MEIQMTGVIAAAMAALLGAASVLGSVDCSRIAQEAERRVYEAQQQEEASALKRRFTSCVKAAGEITSFHDQLVRCADTLITNHNGRRKINAGLSWLYNGLLR